MPRLGQRSRSMLLCASAFAAAALLAHALSLRSAGSSLELLAQQELSAARQGWEALEAEELRILQAALEGLQGDAALQEAFRARDRARLLSLARPLLGRLGRCCRVTHFYFLEPPPRSTCFLRVHRPELSGDRVARATYLQAVGGAEWGLGKELGATAFALRAVRPWREPQGGRLLGYLELGEEMDHFLAAMHQRYGGDYALLLRKDRLDRAAWAALRRAGGLADNWDEHPRFVLAQASAPGGPRPDYRGDFDLVPEAGLVQELERQGRRRLLRGLFPIRDAAGAKVGLVQVWRDVSPLAEELQAGGRKKLGLLLGLLTPLGLLLGAWLARPRA